MAKMKVHELAKEVDRKSKDLIEFLKAEGYDVKVAQSSIEDEAIALVRKEFGSSGEKSVPAGEEKPQKAEADCRAGSRKREGCGSECRTSKARGRE